MLRYTLYHGAINALSHRDIPFIATQYTLYRKITPRKSRRDRQKSPFSRSISRALRDKLFDQKSWQRQRWRQDYSLPSTDLSIRCWFSWTWRDMTHGWNVTHIKFRKSQKLLAYGLSWFLVEKFVMDDGWNRARKWRFLSVAMRFAWGNFAIKGILCCDIPFIAMR